MIKLSEPEKNKKPIKVFHVTEQKYKYPYINPNEDISDNGFSGNAYGTGFYTTDDKEVLKGYKVNLGNPIVRKQRIPRGATVLNYHSLSPEWIQKIENKLLELFPIIYKKDTEGIDNIYDFLKVYRLSNEKTRELFTELNKMFLNLGIDVIKYNPGNFYKNDYKGYNYLIINNQVINKDKKDEIFQNKIETERLLTLEGILGRPNYINNIKFNDLEFINTYYPEKFDILLSKNISINTKIMICLLSKNYKMLATLINDNLDAVCGAIATFSIKYNTPQPLSFLYSQVKNKNKLNTNIIEYLELYDNLSPNFIEKYKHLFPKPLLDSLEKKEHQIIKLCKTGSWKDINDVVEFYKENESYQEKIKEAVKTNKRLLPHFAGDVPYLDASFAEPILNMLGSISPYEMFNILSINKQIFTKDQIIHIKDFYKNMSSNLDQL